MLAAKSAKQTALITMSRNAHACVRQHDGVFLHEECRYIIEIYIFNKKSFKEVKRQFLDQPNEQYALSDSTFHRIMQ